MCGDAWFSWSPSSSEPRGALLTFFNYCFSSVENLSQNEHDSAFTWQVHCAIYTKTSSVLTQCPHKLVSLLFFWQGGDFLLSSFLGKGIFTDSIIRLWNLLNLSPFSKTWILTRPTVPQLWGRGKKLKRKQQPLCCACRYWRVAPSTWTCTLPLCTPQPHPSRDRGIGWFWYLAQYQIRGVSPNAVDLRVFLCLVLYKQKRLGILSIQRVLS